MKCRPSVHSTARVKNDNFEKERKDERRKRKDGKKNGESKEGRVGDVRLSTSNNRSEFCGVQYSYERRRFP